MLNFKKFSGKVGDIKKDYGVNIGSVITKNQEIDDTDLDGEKVMMNLDKGQYFMMNEVGSRIWELIEGNTPIVNIIETLTNEYDVDEEDLKSSIDMDFKEFFKGHELERIIEYTKSIAISPSMFMDFIMFNDGIEVEYEMDWESMICHIKSPLKTCRTIIGIYCDRNYINDTLIYLHELDTNTRRIN